MAVAPLEKKCRLLGQEMRVKQVFLPAKVSPVDERAFYLTKLPTAGSNEDAHALKELEDRLPLGLPMQTPDWFFIRARGRTWEEHLISLKTSHAKKLRRYMRKPAKYGYTIALEPPRKFTQQKLDRCHELLCQTLAYNGDSEFYTRDSFVEFMRSLKDGVLIATSSDGRVLGFYSSGTVIGHDHSRIFKSWGVYHNLFIEAVRSEFRRGAAVIDLGNTNDDFKRELGGTPETVLVELRAGLSLRSAVCLGAWAIRSMLPQAPCEQLRSAVAAAVAATPWRSPPLLAVSLPVAAVAAAIVFAVCAYSFALLPEWMSRGSSSTLTVATVLPGSSGIRCMDVFLALGFFHWAWRRWQGGEAVESADIK